MEPMRMTPRDFFDRLTLVGISSKPPGYLIPGVPTRRHYSANSLVQCAEAGISYVQLAQGLIVGLGLGITVTWVLVRRESNGSSKKKS